MTEISVHPGYLTIDGIIRPNVGCAYTISESLVKHAEAKGPRYRYRDLRLVIETLKSPTTVFEDLRRKGEEKSICIVGRPKSRFLNAGAEVPFPDGYVFLVFATADRKVTGWRVEKCDPDNPQLPENHADRFGTNLWTQQS
jgi:hypothetical protein